MEVKTSNSYQKAVLEKYKKEKGGEMRGYLAEPTSSQIRHACIYLFHRRTERDDNYILNRFFEFRNDEKKLIEIENFGIGKFKAIEKFLKGEAKKTSIKNLNLIAWLIDFQPRPYNKYLHDDEETIIVLPPGGKDTPDKPGVTNTQQSSKRKWSLTIKIAVVFGAILVVSSITKSLLDLPSIENPDFESNRPVTKNLDIDTDKGCMAWADSLYIPVSCDKGPFSKYGTKVEPLNTNTLSSLKKKKVNAATDFFVEGTEQPLIWYSKSDDGGIEYFSAPGLHPITGKTLKAITDHIIDRYVPIHSYNADSFVEE